MGCEAGLGDSTEVRHLQASFFSLYFTLLCIILVAKMCVWNLKYFDELFTVETVKQSLCFRLLAQLRDMESAFDGFFEKHHLKLHQYLQLLRYEQSFQEVRIPSILSHVYIFSCASQQVCCGLLFIFSLCLSKGFCFLFRWSCVWTI